MKSKVNILGTEYSIIYDVPEEEMPEGADGCMDNSIKTIKLAKMDVDRNSLQNMEGYKCKILRHEIVHAFLYESGMWNCSGSCDAWAMDEEMVDWFAIQFPKIFEAFKDVGCL